jgi:hypothetical protein
LIKSRSGLSELSSLSAQSGMSFYDIKFCDKSQKFCGVAFIHDRQPAYLPVKKLL